MPAGVELVVLTVMVEDAELVPVIETGVGLKLTLMPVGKLLVTLRLTFPVKPPEGVTVMALLLEEP